MDQRVEYPTRKTDVGWRALAAEARRTLAKVPARERGNVVAAYAERAGTTAAMIMRHLDCLRILNDLSRAADVPSTDAICEPDAVEGLKRIIDLDPARGMSLIDSTLRGGTLAPDLNRIEATLRAGGQTPTGTAATVAAAVAACFEGDGRLRSATVRTTGLPIHAMMLRMDAIVVVPTSDPNARTTSPARESHAVFITRQARWSRSHGSSVADLAVRVMAATAFHDVVHLYAGSNSEAEAIHAVASGAKTSPGRVRITRPERGSSGPGGGSELAKIAGTSQGKGSRRFESDGRGRV